MRQLSNASCWFVAGRGYMHANESGTQSFPETQRFVERILQVADRFPLFRVTRQFPKKKTPLRTWRLCNYGEEKAQAHMSYRQARNCQMHLNANISS